MRSLRARLIQRTTAAVVATMAVAAAAVYLWMRTSLLSELDAALLFEARSLASHVEQSRGQVHSEPEITAMSDYANTANGHFFQMWTADNSVVLRSPSLGGFDLPLPVPFPSSPVLSSIALPNGARGRIVAISFTPRSDEDDQPDAREGTDPRVTLAVARQTTDIDATLARLGGLLLVVAAAAAAVCVGLTGRVIGRELKPLDQLAGSIEQVGAANLADRIQLPDCPAELGSVVACLNQLLARLDLAMTREKSFTADVAHELRTPLAALETTLEVCASRPRNTAEYQSAVASCLGITRGMHVVVDNLMQLARADAGQCVLKPQPAEISSLIRDCWSRFEVRAAQRRLRCEWALNGAARVRVDHEAAHLVLANLFDNAVSYADDGGRIRTSVVDQDGRLALSIANSGCPLDPCDGTRVFDRFWRGDASRTAAGRHSGLGLSLCRKLVELQDGTITAEIRDGWFSVTLELPAGDE